MMKETAKTFVLAFVAALMLGTPCMAQGASHSSWKRLLNMAVPRWEAGSVVFENELYVFGGYKMPTKACKRVDAFDPKDNSWTKLKDLPSAITHMNMVLDGRSVWFAGGFKDGYMRFLKRTVYRRSIMC
jgi:N-acetylneuraminic acid mutarotase